MLSPHAISPNTAAAVAQAAAIRQGHRTQMYDRPSIPCQTAAPRRHTIPGDRIPI
jgi:hypothetical protein